MAFSYAQSRKMNNIPELPTWTQWSVTVDEALRATAWSLRSPDIPDEDLVTLIKALSMRPAKPNCSIIQKGISQTHDDHYQQKIADQIRTEWKAWADQMESYHDAMAEMIVCCGPILDDDALDMSALSLNSNQPMGMKLQEVPFRMLSSGEYEMADAQSATRAKLGYAHKLVEEFMGQTLVGKMDGLTI